MKPTKLQHCTLGVSKAKQLSISEEASLPVAHPSSPTGVFFFFFTQVTPFSITLPLQYHNFQRATLGSVQLNYRKNFHLKIMILFEISFLMSLLLTVINKQNTVSTVQNQSQQRKMLFK
jgi:hypothetical protein